MLMTMTWLNWCRVFFLQNDFYSNKVVLERLRQNTNKQIVTKRDLFWHGLFCSEGKQNMPEHDSHHGFP